MALYSNHVTKFLSVKCPWCWCMMEHKTCIIKHLQLMQYTRSWNSLRKCLQTTQS